MKTPTSRPELRPATTLEAQRGFVGSAARITLLLVALLVSATAYALDAVGDSAADINSSYLLSMGSDVERALERAAADNELPRGAVARSVALDDSRSSSRIGLFDARLKYGRAPHFPAGLLVEGVKGSGSLRWTDEEAQVIEVAGIDLAVCRRVNERLQRVPPDQDLPAGLGAAREGRGWTQGCWAKPGASSGTWFIEVFAETLCRGGEACRDGNALAAVRTPVRQAADEGAEAEPVVLTPADALAQCAAREAAAGLRDPQEVAARCTASS